MNIIEEKYLKRSIQKLNKFVKDNRDFLDFFNSADEMMNKPLQDLSFKSDLNFFDEVSFILSVITSIISHPHMINKGEEIIIRSELAPSLSNEMFQKTIRDPQLWSEDGIDMIPEYVYYYQQIDELRIYENIFIVMLVKKIEAELTKYHDFYVSMIQKFNGQESLTLKNDNSDIAFKRLNLLIRKIKRIKHTYFYRVVNKGNTNLGIVRPTNILVKDRLYNYCFKFYKKLITYNDKYSRLQDIRLYYFVQFVKAIKSLGFTLYMDDISLFRFDDYKKLIIPHTVFESEDFDLTIYPDEINIGLILEVKNNNIKNNNANISKHLLLFDSLSTFNGIDYRGKNEYETVNALSLWNMAEIDDDIKVLFNNPRPEIELITDWVKSKISTVSANMDIYSVYCPVCKGQLIDEDDDKRITCDTCNSIYTFFKKKHNPNDYLWFIKLRR